MITTETGNLLDADVEALVNTVNTVGVMGKGIALQFKRAYPTMFKAYESSAKRGEVQIGRMHLWFTDQLDGPRLVINFPTKRHWRSSSVLADIEAGLDDLVRVIRQENVTSIAVPPLGCGHGGLQWSQVEPLIREKLGPLDDVAVKLYPPSGAPSAASMRSAGPKPRMTMGRAALIEVVNRYASLAVEGALPIAVQKLMYFLQASGEDLRLNFEKNLYGPYADNLRLVLRDVEGHFLVGFGDGSQAVEVSEPFRVLPGAALAASEVLASSPLTLERVDRVFDLACGFESASSLELLGTVHWIATHPHATGRTDLEIATEVRRWSARKARLFDTGQVQKALDVLRQKDWIAR